MATLTGKAPDSVHGAPRPTIDLIVAKEDVRSFEFRPIVAGSRSFNDYAFFCEAVVEYLATVLPGATRDNTVFISGHARSGADAMIIRWCEENGWFYSLFPAAWDDVNAPGAVVRTNGRGKPYNVRAGFIRNGEMAEVGTHLLTFYDGVSNGTPDMIEHATQRKLSALTIIVEPDSRK